jgi:tRNA C32,U32 (ribose-2'-O)-methylase TrmJ
MDKSLPLASAEQVQEFFQHLEMVLNEIGFLKSPSVRLLRKIKRIFSRTPLQEQEVNILRGILASVQYHQLHGKDQENDR